MVTNPVGTEGISAKEETNCLLDRTNKEIAQLVAGLLEDPQSCATIGTSARRFTTSRFNVDGVPELFSAQLILQIPLFVPAHWLLSFAPACNPDTYTRF